MNDPILALFSVPSFVTHDQGYTPVYNGGDIAEEPRYCTERAEVLQRRSRDTTEEESMRAGLDL